MNDCRFQTKEGENWHDVATGPYDLCHFYFSDWARRRPDIHSRIIEIATGQVVKAHYPKGYPDETDR